MSSPTGGRFAAATLLVLCATLAGSAARRTSVTVDEFTHLPLGIIALQDPAAPALLGAAPLPNVLAASAVRLAGSARIPPDLAASGTSWEAGYRFAEANRDRYHAAFLPGRAVMLLGLLAVGLIVLGFAGSLHGPAGGLLALAVVSLEPSLLAHGGLLGSDLLFAGAMLGALWALDAFLRRPGRRGALLLGAALGAACLIKLTGALLLVLVPPAALAVTLLPLRRWEGDPFPGGARRAVALGLGAALAVALLTVNLGYGFRGSLAPAGELPFRSDGFRAAQRLLPAALPVPLPAAYLLGMDHQLLGEEAGESYLLGEFREGGFPGYYLIALAVKTPEPILLLAAAALLLLPRIAPREVPSLLVGAGSLAFFSLVGRKNIGARYVLFLLPLAAVWIGRLATVRPRDPRRGRLLRGALGVALAWLLLIAVGTWPHYLAYFNAASGGTAAGHRRLLDSNLDWGQDLITLRRYLEREGIGEVDLAYFGRVDPALYGIRYRPAIGAVRNRYVVISANLLWGRRYFLGGTEFLPDRDYYARFRDLAPKAVLGGSLYIFDMAGVSSPAGA